ncbi:hypothetical protein [Nocardia wallacei]|uniref:hypothetical protein n=1 Tax=Nocardia wallacei TaxID=480035 RepID=UPI0024547BEF|nr:hypothetical protein [Nocardia wallacei]
MQSSCAGGTVTDVLPVHGADGEQRRYRAARAIAAVPVIMVPVLVGGWFLGRRRSVAGTVRMTSP